MERFFLSKMREAGLMEKWAQRVVADASFSEIYTPELCYQGGQMDGKCLHAVV